MVKLVLFDIDGTLLHTGGAGRKAFRHAFASAFGIPDGTDGIEFAGRTDTGIVRELFLKHAVEHTPRNIRHFFDAYYFWLDHILHQSEGAPCPHSREFVDSVRALVEPPVIGLLTGNVRLGAEIKLRHYHFWQDFRTGGFGDDHEDRNEIARIAQVRGTELLGKPLRGEEILVVGDTPLDIACARAISAKCLAVATGHASVSELESHHPTWAVSDLSQVDARAVCV